MVGTVKGGQFRTHFKTGHGELADELEVGSGMRKRKKKNPRTMSGFLGSFKLKRLPFPGTILQAERACPGGRRRRVDRRPRVRLGQVKFQLAVRHLGEDFIF